MFRKIKDERVKAGMTQEMLADASGVSRTTINGLESGKITKARTETIRQIAHALGLTMDALFSDEGV